MFQALKLQHLVVEFYDYKSYLVAASSRHLSNSLFSSSNNPSCCTASSKVL